MALTPRQISKQAWILTKQHKFLWGFGLFLVWANLGAYLILASLFEPPRGGGAGIVRVDLHSLTSQTMGFALMLILAFLFFAYFRSRSGIISATKDLIEHKPTSFGAEFSQNARYSPGLLQLWVFMAIALVMSSYILTWPVSHLYANNLNGRANVLASLAGVIFAFTIYLVFLFNTLAGNFIVLMRLTVADALRASHDLIGAYWSALLRFSLRMVLATIIACALVILGQVVIMLPFVFLSGLSYDIGANLLKSPAILAGFVFSLIYFFWIFAVTAAYQRVCWTLVFLELVKAKRSEELVPVQEEAVTEEVV